MDLNKTINAVKPLDKKFVEKSNEKWNSIAKPLRSLGELENIVSKIAGITKTTDIILDKRCVVIMCADNGVVEEKVTQADDIVTTIMTENFVLGNTTVCKMAQYIHTDIVTVDIGVKSNLHIDGLINKKILNGTNNITKGMAMSREDAVRAIEIGIEIAYKLKEEGYKIVLTGEMGIGNTTTSAAIASVLFELPVLDVVGRGAGLDEDGLIRKREAVEKAININMPDKDDVIDVLSKVGGLDIAGIVGLYIGCAAVELPIVLDGFISGISAVIAEKLCKSTKDYMIPSHVSKEPAGKLVLDYLGFTPIITAGLCLGEGTGAVAGLSLIDMALFAYNNTITFADINIEKYVHFK